MSRAPFRSSRRVAGALASAVAASTSLACAARRPTAVLPVLPELAAPRELTADQQVRHALARLTFGARPNESERLRDQLDLWLRRQLVPETVPDPAIDSLVGAHPVLGRTVAALTAESPPLDIFLRERRRALGLADTARYVMT